MITSPLRDSFTLWGQSSPLCANFTPGGNPFAMSVLPERMAVQVTIFSRFRSKNIFSDIADGQGDHIGEFSPIGCGFNLASVLKIKDVVHMFGLHFFHGYALIVTQKWATFWAIFFTNSSGHPADGRPGPPFAL
jgi:hypothetical protein